jgi:DNA-binding transcriptional ArsR family regulator
MIESIAPERVAKIVAPLGSEERLRLLDFLKAGGKSFNDIENHTGKTGSSLTHHLNPLVEAGYVVKGEVRGTYYVTVEGRLAYRLAQWLTHRVESQRKQNGNNGDAEVAVEFVDDESDLEKAEEHLEKLADKLEEKRDDIEEHREAIEEAREEEEARAEELEDEDDDTDDLDDLDWKE